MPLCNFQGVEEAMTTFSGAWPALVTPFTNNNQVHVPVLRRLVDYLIDKQIGGFYVCGSTGEGIYMSVAERKLVLETVIEQNNTVAPKGHPPDRCFFPVRSRSCNGRKAPSRERVYG